MRDPSITNFLITIYHANNIRITRTSPKPLTPRKHKKNHRKLGNPVRVAWRDTLSRQAVHIKTQKNKSSWHEQPGGPSTPPGGFWKFPEIQQNSTQIRIHIATIQ